MNAYRSYFISLSPVILFAILTLGYSGLAHKSNIDTSNYSYSQPHAPAQTEGITGVPVAEEDPQDWLYAMTDSLGIPEQVVRLAINGQYVLRYGNYLENDSLLTIIDFSRPSVENRLFILDLKNNRVLRSSLVAHGRNSGKANANRFSNEHSSYKSSLGFYVTKGTYQGKHGYSLRLQGLSKGLNTNAYARGVVIHGADYVSRDFITRNGWLGRSFGCPALPMDQTHGIIDLIKGGSCILIYHPDLLAKDDLGIVPLLPVYPGYTHR